MLQSFICQEYMARHCGRCNLSLMVWFSDPSRKPKNKGSMVRTVQSAEVGGWVECPNGSWETQQESSCHGWSCALQETVWPLPDVLNVKGKECVQGTWVGYFCVETNTACWLTHLTVLPITDEPVTLWSNQCAGCGQKDVNSLLLGTAAPFLHLPSVFTLASI